MPRIAVLVRKHHVVAAVLVDIDESQASVTAVRIDDLVPGGKRNGSFFQPWPGSKLKQPNGLPVGRDQLRVGRRRPRRAARTPSSRPAAREDRLPSSSSPASSSVRLHPFVDKVPGARRSFVAAARRIAQPPRTTPKRTCVLTMAGGIDRH